MVDLNNKLQQLKGARAHLHGGVIHNHLLELDIGIELGNLLDRAEEQPIAQLHDVRLVNGRHLKMIF